MTFYSNNNSSHNILNVLSLKIAYKDVQRQIPFAQTASFNVYDSIF